jgi:hypothetical protein
MATTNPAPTTTTTASPLKRRVILTLGGGLMVGLAFFLTWFPSIQNGMNVIKAEPSQKTQTVAAVTASKNYIGSVWFGGGQSTDITVTFTDSTGQPVTTTFKAQQYAIDQDKSLTHLQPGDPLTVSYLTSDPHQAFLARYNGKSDYLKMRYIQTGIPIGAGIVNVLALFLGLFLLLSAILLDSPVLGLKGRFLVSAAATAMLIAIQLATV